MLTVRRIGRLLIVQVLCLSLGHEVFAQSTAQFPVQFDFTNPGARSLATGGAFIGSADDATAAFTNPAGLVFYGKRELSLEGRFGRLLTPFLAGGRITGNVTGAGLDTVAGPIYVDDRDARMGLAFASVTFPLGRSTVTGYRHELARVENAFSTQGVFHRATFAGVTDDANRELPLAGTRAVGITNYGVTVGFKVHDKLGVGGGLSVAHFRLDSQFQRFGLLSNSFSPPDRNLVIATATQDGSDYALAVNAGVLWKPNDALSVGATFRPGPRFDFVQRDRVVFPPLDLERQGQFKVPDVWGAGVAWQRGDLRLLADYSRVHYSQLKEDFIDFQAIASDRSDQLRIADGNEVRGGAEYVLQILKPARPLAIRAGAWLDPDHTITYIPTAAADATDALFTATLPGGERLIHYTVGGGLAWSTSFEVHAAADFSSRTRHATATVVKRF